MDIAFLLHFSSFSSMFDSILLTVHNKMFEGRGKNVGRVRKPETHI